MVKRSTLTLLLSLAACLVILFQSPAAEAKVFRNSYIQFQLPDQWACYLANTAWVCRYAIPQKCAKKDANSKDCIAHKKKTREAIIILTAKETGPKDSLPNYKDYLKSPKTAISRSGKRVQSKLVHLEEPKISGVPWVDGMHLGSEVPNYYTRYLATVKQRVAVLVTFSAHKRHYTKYSSQFFETIKTLRVIQPKGGLGSSNTRRGFKKPPPRGNRTSMDPEIFEDIDASEIDGGEMGDGFLSRWFGGEHGTTNFLMLMAFILAAIGSYIWFRGQR